jgi:hypothetical protein
LSSVVRNSRPEKHGNDGKFDAGIPPALVHVVATSPHLVERGRIDAVLLFRPPGDRVQADVRNGGALEHPTVVPGLVADNARRLSAYRPGSRPSKRSGGSTTWSSTLMNIISSTCISPPRRPSSLGALHPIHVSESALRS